MSLILQNVIAFLPYAYRIAEWKVRSQLVLLYTTGNLVVPRCRLSTYGTRAELSVSLVQSAGMPCQTIWSHQIFRSYF